VILRVKEAGMELVEIRDMLAAREPEQLRAILRRRRADLTQQIAARQASLALVDCALNCDHDDIITCDRFQQFIVDRITSVVHRGADQRAHDGRGPRRSGRGPPSLQSDERCPTNGATMASPSVVLNTANPTNKAVPSASTPTAYAEHIASPSPKLCSPMPMAIMNVSDLRIDAALQQRGREPGGLLPLVGSLSHA
jgi:hypothetical protein